MTDFDQKKYGAVYDQFEVTTTLVLVCRACSLEKGQMMNVDLHELVDFDQPVMNEYI